MANKKISDLTELLKASLTGEEYIPIDSSGLKKISLETLDEYIDASNVELIEAETERAEAAEEATDTALSAIKETTKNLLSVNDISVSAYTEYIKIDAIPAGTYKVSAGNVTSTDTDGSYCALYFFNSDKTSNAHVSLPRGDDVTATTNLTLSFDAAYARFYSGSNASKSVGDTSSFTNVMVEESDAVTNYVPHIVAKDDVARNMVAEKAVLSTYADVEWETFEDRGTNIYVVKVPRYNADGSINTLKCAVTDSITDDDTGVTSYNTKTVAEFSRDLTASVCVNGGFFARSVGTNIPHGVVIVDGVAIEDKVYENNYNEETLGILADGSFKYYDSATLSATAMISDGVMYALSGMGHVITGGAVDSDKISGYPDDTTFWQVVGYDSSMNYYFISCESGTIARTTALAKKYGVIEGYCLDGGGSVSTNPLGIKLNANKDDNGKTDRSVPAVFYIPGRSNTDANFKLLTDYVSITNDKVKTLEASLSGCTFSVNGSTLTITDGTHTWTLSATE